MEDIRWHRFLRGYLIKLQFQLVSRGLLFNDWLKLFFLHEIELRFALFDFLPLFGLLFLAFSAVSLAITFSIGLLLALSGSFVHRLVAIFVDEGFFWYFLLVRNVIHDFSRKQVWSDKNFLIRVIFRMRLLDPLLISLYVCFNFWWGVEKLLLSLLIDFVSLIQIDSAHMVCGINLQKHGRIINTKLLEII